MEASPRILPTGTVTFLFTDIEGSTRLLQELGDQYDRVQDEHAAIMRAAISHGGGQEIRTEGDSFFVAFPTALGAVRAAAAAQRELETHAWPHGRPLRVRMGLHTGEGRLGGDDYLGIDVNRAARIAAAGHGGQVLLSDATRALVAQDLPDGVAVRGLGEHRLKDVAQPMRIFQLVIEGLPSEFRELRTMDARPTNLPPYLTSFVGRQREVVRVKELIVEHRLVTLTGPGGSGKTRLALEAAAELLARFRDGVFFVDLVPVTLPDLVPLAVARGLGLMVDPGGDAVRAAQAHLRDRRLLLLLDNFEQVVEGAGLIESLLSVAPELRILVTSRVPLRIYGEQEYPVPPLELPVAGRAHDELPAYEAVALFVDRARAVKPDFDLTDDTAPIVAEITARLDGLPLAIELAAARIRVLTPEAILSRLDRRLPLLAASGRGRPERQQTMGRAIDWSYDLLREPERRLFARLSVFPGGCSVQAAEAVCDPGDLGVEVLDGLGALVEHSLLRQTETSGGEPRVSMLETILEYAAERLREEFDADATHRRLAEFLMAFAEEAEAHLTTDDQVIWLDRCEEERPNLRSAMSWAVEAGEAELGLRTASALWRFWQQRGPMWEGREVLDRLLAIRGGPPAVRAKTLGAAGSLAWWGDDIQATQRRYEEALSLAQESGDPRVEMEALLNRAFVAAWNAAEGPDVAEGLLRRSLALAEDLGDTKGIARAHGGLGFLLAVVRGDFASAVPVFEKSLTLWEDLGERLQVSDTLISLGNANRRLGELERARDYYLRGLDMMVASRNRPMSAGLLFLISALESDMGRHERAARLWGAAEAAREVTGAVRPAVAERLVGDPLAAARGAIGDEAVDRALAEGRVMDLDAAIAYAHQDA